MVSWLIAYQIMWLWMYGAWTIDSGKTIRGTCRLKDSTMYVFHKGLGILGPNS